MKKIFISTFLLICFVLGLVFLCSNYGQKNTKLTKMPNKVVFILVDTLRADHLPFYGYKHNTSPFLNSLMNSAILFKNFYSTSSYTAPATASLFTSLFQAQHGVKQGFIYYKRDESVTLNRIPSDAVTLGEVFKEAGYNTFAVADNLNISKEMGFSQGFDEMSTTQYKGASDVNKRVLALKDKLKSSSKYFLYIHYMDPHSPYNLQKKWARKGKENSAIKRYDSEISYVDDAIKSLYKELKWDEDTLIVFTADHGEAFGERVNFNGKKERGHGKTLNREVLRVPLFYYKNGLKGKTLTLYSSHLDVLPTLASLLNVNKDNNWQGDDLSKLLSDDNVHYKNRYLFADLEGKEKYDKPNIHSVIYDDFHYIKTLKTANRKGKEEFFDWKEDEVELKSNLDANRDLLNKMQTKVNDHLSIKSSFSNDSFNLKLDKKTKEHLSTLGYIN